METRKGVFLILFLSIVALDFATAVDLDRDGLSEEVEATLGSSDLHKDIYVEIDWLIVQGRNLKPRPGFVQIVTSIFAAAPVLNPDGTTGIRMHIVLSQGIKTTQGVLGSMFPNGDYDWSDFDAIKAQYFTPSRWNTHHYCLFIKDYGDENGQPLGSSGLSRNGRNFRAGASDFIVSLGGDNWFNYPRRALFKYTQAGTFVHELGHNLGLRHGGPDHTNYKPNLLSLMNYSFQVDGIPFTGFDGNRYRIYDYSRILLPPLNENNLNEFRGLGSPASDENGVFGTDWYLWDGEKFVQYETFDATANVDWNADGTLSSSVKENINQDVRKDAQGNLYPKYSNLRSLEEWSKLVFNGGFIGKSSLSTVLLPRRTSLPCLTFKEYIALRKGKPEDDNIPRITWAELLRRYSKR